MMLTKIVRVGDENLELAKAPPPRGALPKLGGSDAASRSSALFPAALKIAHRRRTQVDSLQLPFAALEPAHVTMPPPDCPLPNQVTKICFLGDRSCGWVLELKVVIGKGDPIPGTCLEPAPIPPNLSNGHRCGCRKGFLLHEGEQPFLSFFLIPIGKGDQCQACAFHRVIARPRPPSAVPTRAGAGARASGSASPSAGPHDPPTPTPVPSSATPTSAPATPATSSTPPPVFLSSTQAYP